MRSFPRLARRVALVTGAILLALPAAASGGVGGGGGTPGTHQHFQLVGHEPLFNRGMNAAPAIYRDFVYVGSRTDVGPGHSHPGVQIVSVRDPAHPRIVGEIGRPEAARPGFTSRELRVWPQEKLLIVMLFTCSSVIHECAPLTDQPSFFQFFDLSDPVHPRLIKSYVPRTTAGDRVKPHEMYLWVDPQRPRRALLYYSTPTLSVNRNDPNLIVDDISNVRGGAVRRITQFNANAFYPHAANPANYDFNLFTHSMALNPAGTRMYLSQEAGEFVEADTSEVAAGRANPRIHLITDPRLRPRWENPNGHSAVKVPGRQLVLTTDEIYGSLLGPSQGCPWGWMRLIDVSNPRNPSILSEYKIAQNQRTFCRTKQGDNDRLVSYTSHNPTVLHDLALIGWHSGGLQAIDLANPRNPTQAGWYSPIPLRHVATEDPALSAGPNKVVMWSYPIIKDGLIYIVDIRNGLYILRYTGPHHGAVDATKFLEGNSNLGDLLR